MSKCQCDVCNYSRMVNEYIQKLEDPDDREFFLNMYDMLIHSEMDRDYYKAIVDGQWPNADELIQKRRNKGKNDVH
jgi:hypothetical protein